MNDYRKDSLEAWSKKLKKLREKLGVSQAKLAQILEVTKEAVYRWEAQKRLPAWDQQRKIEKVITQTDTPRKLKRFKNKVGV